MSIPVGFGNEVLHLMVIGIKIFTDTFYVPQLTLHYSFGIKFCFIKKFLGVVVKDILIFNKMIT